MPILAEINWSAISAVAGVAAVLVMIIGAAAKGWRERHRSRDGGDSRSSSGRPSRLPQSVEREVDSFLANGRCMEMRSQLEQWRVLYPNAPIVWLALLIATLEESGAMAAQALVAAPPLASIGKDSEDLGHEQDIVTWGQWLAVSHVEGRLPAAVRAGSFELSAGVDRFVGRTRELRSARTFIDRTLAGRGGLLVISGDEGIGKTQLLAQALKHESTDAAEIIAIDARQAGASLWSELARPLWLELRRDRPPQRPLFDHRSEMELLAFASLSAPQNPHRKLNAIPTLDASRAVELVSEVLRARARRHPILVVIENTEALARTLDDSLAYLSQLVADFRVAVIITLRDSELQTGTAFHRFVERVHEGACAGVTALPLKGLAREDIASLAKHGSLPIRQEDHVDTLMRLTDGNPLLVAELLHGDYADLNLSNWEQFPLAQRFEAVFDQRWARCAASDRRLLGVAAVLAQGREFDPEMVGLIAHETKECVHAILSRAAERRIIDPGRPNTFAHELWRGFIYSRVSQPDRAALHRDALDYFEQRPDLLPSDSTRRSEVLAYHVRNAVPLLSDDRYVTLSTRAAELAADAATDSALFERAGDLYSDAAVARSEASDQRAAMLLQAAEAYRIAGEWTKATKAILEAFEVARQKDDSMAMASAALALPGIAWDPDSYATRQIEPLAREALNALPPEQQSLKLALEATVLGRQEHQADSETVRNGHALLARAATIADPSAKAVILRNVWAVLAGQARPEEQLGRSLEADRLTRNAGLASLRTFGATDYAVDLLRLGRFESARDHVRQIDDLHSPPLRYIWTSMRALIELASGDFERAEVHTATADRLGRELGGRAADEVTGAQRLWTWYERLDELDEAFTDALLHQAHFPDHDVHWRLAQAIVLAELAPRGTLIAQGILREAATATADFSKFAPGPMRIAGLAMAAQALAAVSDAPNVSIDVPSLAGNVLKGLQAHQDLGVLLGWPAVYVGAKARFIGLAALASDDIPLAITQLHAAEKLDIACKPHLARGQLALARALLKRGDSAGATEKAARAERIATKVGMPAVLRHARKVTSQPHNANGPS